MFNNRKATRFSNRKYRKNIVDKDLYKKWKSDMQSKLSFKEFKLYWKLIAREFINEIILETDGIRLGSSTGDLYIGYVPSKKGKNIDYKLSLEHGIKIFHENWNSSGKLGKIVYGTYKRPNIYKRSSFWSFSACRNFKIKVKESLKQNPERYKNSIEKRSLLL